MSHPQGPLRRSATQSTNTYPLLTTVIGLLACVGMLGAALFGVFRVRHVQVVGTTAPPDVVQASGVMGANIFTVRSDQVVARLQVLRTLEIDRVETRFPNSVTVYARLRPRMVAWKSGRSLYELDSQGRPVQQVASSSLPEITTTDGNSLPSSSVVQALHFEAPALVRSAHGTVVVYEYASKTGLTVRGSTGWTGEIGNGSAQTLANRLATLSALLDTLRRQGKRLDYADLRYRVPYARSVKP